MPQILKLGGERVVAKAVGQGKLTRVIDATATQVEGDCRESGPGDSLGEMGEHSPVFEALEAVHDGHRRPGRAPAPGANIDQHLSERA
jgi:hypothetical protein